MRQPTLCGGFVAASVAVVVITHLMLAVLAATASMAETFPADLTPLRFEDLEGWATDDHAAALKAFRRTCTRAVEHPPRTRPAGMDSQALVAICARLLAGEPNSARNFFEEHFMPYRVEAPGLLTGYFEPQLEASFTRTARFQYPLHARPTDLVELSGPASRFGITQDVTWGRATESGFEAFFDRGEIMAGALDRQGLELVYLESPIDAFFTHIQGSARLAMTDGSVQRVNFAGKTGHVYTPIGRTLVEMGELALEDVTMTSLRDWLERANPEDRDTVLATNRSYIFFAIAEDTEPEAGPVAAAGVPLTPGRSLAVDRHLHTFGSPVFVSSQEALPGESDKFTRLMIAQDTGSAIVGPARGDIFIGSGKEAGEIAGQVNQPVTFTLLLPRIDG
ncbi:MAG: MltA domain-containing protein [Pseudomonadota bacterium]